MTSLLLVLLASVGTVHPGAAVRERGRPMVTALLCQKTCFFASSLGPIFIDLRYLMVYAPLISSYGQITIICYNCLVKLARLLRLPAATLRIVNSGPFGTERAPRTMLARHAVFLNLCAFVRLRAPIARRIFPSYPVTVSPMRRPRKFFSCNTYGFTPKCCKQKTYGGTKSFRYNTYEKHGGEGSPRGCPSPTFRSKLHHNCGAEIPTRSGRCEVQTFQRVPGPSSFLTSLLRYLLISPHPPGCILLKRVLTCRPHLTLPF